MKGGGIMDGDDGNICCSWRVYCRCGVVTCSLACVILYVYDTRLCIHIAPNLFMHVGYDTMLCADN